MKKLNILLCLIIATIVWLTKATTSDKIIIDVLMLVIAGFWLSVKNYATNHNSL